MIFLAISLTKCKNIYIIKCCRLLAPAAGWIVFKTILQQQYQLNWTYSTRYMTLKFPLSIKCKTNAVQSLNCHRWCGQTYLRAEDGFRNREMGSQNSQRRTVFRVEILWDRTPRQEESQMHLMSVRFRKAMSSIFVNFSKSSFEGIFEDDLSFDIVTGGCWAVRGQVYLFRYVSNERSEAWHKHRHSHSVTLFS